MRILTEAYKDREFFIPLDQHKTEGVYAKPVSSTTRRKLAQIALRDAGGDVLVANYLESVAFLQESLSGWKGMYDIMGNEIAFSSDVVRMVCEYDPDAAANFVHRVKNIARFGDLEDEKN